MGVLDRVHELAAQQHGAIAHRQANNKGLSYDAMYRLHDSGLWVPLHDGVSRVQGAPVTWRQGLMAATLAGGNRAVASHEAAAALWGLPDCRPGPVVVTVPVGCDYTAQPVTKHVARKLYAADITSVDRIPVMTVTRVLLDMAAYWSAVEMQDAMDDAFRRGLSSPARMHWRLRELGGRGRTGTRLVRTLLTEYQPGHKIPASVFERRFRRVLQSAGLPLPIVRYVVRVGGRNIEVDAAWPDRMLCAECDSSLWHDTLRRAEDDAEKRALLVAAGWRVYPLRWNKLRTRPDQVVVEIRSALAAAPIIVPRVDFDA